MTADKLLNAATYAIPKGPPSMLYSNLHTAHADGSVVYISKNTVMRYAPMISSLNTLGSYQTAVNGICAVPPADLEGPLRACAPLFVAVGATSIDLYIGGKPSATMDLSGSMKRVGEGACAALTVMGSGTRSATIAVGTSTGCVLFVHADLSPDTPGGLLTATQAPVNANDGKKVTAVDVRHCAGNAGRTGAFAVSGNIAGQAVLWNYDLQPYMVIPAQGQDCVTGAKVCSEYNALVVLAYGSGKLQVHSAATGALEVCVRAHSQWITALAYAPTRGGLLASCAEDSAISIWSLPAASARTEEEAKKNAHTVVEVRHLGSAALDGWVPTGVAIAVDGASVAVSCYDDPALHVLSIP